MQIKILIKIECKNYIIFSFLILAYVIYSNKFKLQFSLFKLLRDDKKEI